LPQGLKRALGLILQGGRKVHPLRRGLNYLLNFSACSGGGKLWRCLWLKNPVLWLEGILLPKGEGKNGLLLILVNYQVLQKRND